MDVTALIAEDEPLLLQVLQAELQRQWPELRIVATATHGQQALELALAHRPQVCFLDVRMPGMTGLEAAQALAEDWPPDAGAFPLIVFVTAYDQYALQAFEAAAVDYVLKPVEAGRLAQTCSRLRALLGRRQADRAPDLEQAMAQLRALLRSAPPASAEPLRFVQASSGATVHLVPLDEVLYFEAADKYVRVVTAEREHLIRTSLRELLPRLDAAQFWQVHRGTVVRTTAIEAAVRDETGKLHLRLRGRPERLAVSRLYAHLFKPM